MKTYLPIVFLNSLCSVPLKLFFVLAVGSIGSFLPIVLSGGIETLSGLWWMILFFPLYLFFVGIFSGWWAFIAIPLIFVLAYNACQFLLGDYLFSKLMIVFTLAFLITIRVGMESCPVLSIVLALLFVAGSYLLHRRDKRFYPM